MPSADFCMAIRPPYDSLSPNNQTPHRPPEVSHTAFAPQPPDLLPECPDEYGLHHQMLTRPHAGSLISDFCSSAQGFAWTLPSACTSRYKPCASPVLRPHLAGQGTFTPRLYDMLGHTSRSALTGLNEIHLTPGSAGVLFRFKIAGHTTCCTSTSVLACHHLSCLKISEQTIPTQSLPAAYWTRRTLLAIHVQSH